MKWQHIYPVGDLKEHSTEWPKKELCECDPRIDWEDKLVIHNAYDCREAVEEAEEILLSGNKPEIVRTSTPTKRGKFCDCGVFGKCSKYCLCKCHQSKSKPKIKKK